MRCTPLNRAKTSRHTRTDKASLALHGARQRFNPPSVPSGRRRKLLCRCAAPPLNRATIFWRARTDKVALAHHGARQRFKRPPARRGTGGANYSADALRPPEQGKDLPARANGLRRSRASWRAATLQKTPGAPSGRRRKPLGKLTVTRSASACGQGCDEPLGPSLLRDLDETAAAAISIPLTGMRRKYLQAAPPIMIAATLKCPSPAGRKTGRLWAHTTAFRALCCIFHTPHASNRILNCQP